MFLILGWRVFYKNFVKIASSFLSLVVEVQKDSSEADSEQFVPYYDV